MKRIALLLTTITLAACGDDVTTGDAAGAPLDASAAADAPPGDGDASPQPGDAPPGDARVINPTDGPIPDGAVVLDGGVICIPAACQGKIYQCGNCRDDDGDGRIDSEDPDCLGACQNNEGGFAGEIPGQNNAPCKADCYFDQDTGSGNDTCEWDRRCDPNEKAPNFDPETGCDYDPTTKFPGGQGCAEKLASQPSTCKSFCGRLSPNGCDCFGCCVLPGSTSTTSGVFLGSRDSSGAYSCDLKHLNDPKRCRPCQIVTGCFNACGKCELCVGKPDLPPECYGPVPTPDGGTGTGDAGVPPRPDGGYVPPDGGVPGQCPGAEQPCGLAGQAPCSPGFYCITGCCQPIIG